MKIGYSTDKGMRRPVNEDAVKVLPEADFFMLADGVGGNKSGEVASQAALDALENFVLHNPLEWLEDRDEIFRYFEAAVDYVNQSIFKLSENNPQYAGMATTLVFAFFRDNVMYVANVGDSRVYVFHDNDATQVTEDHTYVNDLVKMGVITRDEASNHNRKNVITRAIGANAFSKPDCFSVFLDSEDRVLICSDGLYDEVPLDLMMSWMTKTEDMDMCAQGLVALANKNGGNDNISVICISMEEQ